MMVRSRNTHYPLGTTGKYRKSCIARPWCVRLGCPRTDVIMPTPSSASFWLSPGSNRSGHNAHEAVVAVWVHRWDSRTLCKWTDAFQRATVNSTTDGGGCDD